MSKNNIRLSKKYGVNPSMIICPLCKKDQGIALNGYIKGDLEAPKYVYGEFCEECMNKIIKDKRVLVYLVTDDAETTLGFTTIPRDSIKEGILKDNQHIVRMLESDFNELMNKKN